LAVLVVFKSILFLMVLLGIGFAAGYGTREWMSRRRRAIAREEYLRKREARPGDIDRGENDFDVLEDGRCIVRIFLLPAAPPDRNWMWIITAPEYPPTFHSRGYSPAREQAMKDFKAQWASDATRN
jgi:hypothetical protein